MSEIGLTLGKFAPLHKGHQYMIETALSETDHLIVVIYDASEVTPVPLNIRAGWIRQLYPQVEVIEGWGGPSDMGDTPEIRRKQEEYILGLLGGRKITRFYSSEFYGDHMSRALGAVNRVVDRDRRHVPISGTDIRSNPGNYREFLSPVVYRDLVLNVVFLGAPSTGKTTMARQAAEEYRTVWMPEYGREYWELHQQNRRLSLTQLVEIAEEHLRREEEKLWEADRFLFCDTNALTTCVFSLYYHQQVHPRLRELAAMSEQRYDLFVLCDTDIPYEDTWDRSGEVERGVFQKMMIGDLKGRNIPYVTLSGTPGERMKRLDAILQRHRKFSSIAALLDL